MCTVYALSPKDSCLRGVLDMKTIICLHRTTLAFGIFELCQNPSLIYKSNIFFSLFCTSLSRKWFYHNKRKQNSLQYNWRSWYLIAWFLVHFMILPSTVAKTFSILLFILLTSTTAAIYKWLHHIALWIVFRTVSVNIVVLLTLAKVVYDFNLLL